jgi:uncharacterized protein (TIGR03437 family)
MYAPDTLSSAKYRSVYRFYVVSLILTVIIGTADVSERVKAMQTVGQLVSVSAASYERNVAPDSIIAAFGTNLATITQVANTLPLPNILSNITVEVNGRSTALLFISPAQINYLLPEDVVEGTGQVLVKRNGQIVAAGEIEIRAGAPSIFMANVDAQGPPAANLLRVRVDNSQVLESASQFDGTKGRFVSRVIDLDAPNELVFLILYLTGTSKEPQAGDYRVLLGGSECRPDFMPYIGVAPGFAGLKQINLNLGGCVRKLREEDTRANFTGKVSVALADIKNAQTSNVFELEFAPPTGAPPRVTGLNKATLLAGDALELQGSGLAETSEVYLTDANANRFNAQIEKPVTPTTVRVRVPFGAGTGTVTAVTGRGDSTFPLTMRTSVSGVVQLVQRQPDGTDRRIGLRGATVRIVSPSVSPAALSGDDGSFLIPDVQGLTATQGTAIYLNVDASTAGITNLSLKRVDRMIAFAGRDNQYPGYLELRPSTGPSIPVASNGLLSAEPIRISASARPEENMYTGQTGEIVFEPNGSTVRFADGSTVNAVTVTALDTGRVPVDLPAGQFSSTIVQLTPFGGQIAPGGKLSLPNTDGLPGGTTATLYRYVQTSGNAALGQWVPEGIAQVSADGKRVETGQNAVKETSYYFVSVPRPLTTIYGSVKEADGQPARAAQVQVRGQSGFALTDVNGGFLLRNVPVVGAEAVIEVNYLRPDETVDRAERRGVTLRIGTTSISPPIVLPGQGQGRAPVLLLPKILTIEAGKTTDYTFLAYARVASATLQLPLVTGVLFASITSLNNDRYALRLAPGPTAVGNYTVTIAATDSQSLKSEETIALEVRAPGGNVPAAVGQSITTDEDQPVGITLSGSGGTQYRIVNEPQRGRLSGIAPNLVYTPNQDFNGSDNFNFVIGNGSAESPAATVTIAVRPVSDAPRLEVGASFKTNIGQLLGVVINGFDPDVGQTLSLTNTQLPAGAKIERTTGTSWVLEWRPTGQQIGSYTVDLTLRDDGAPSLSDTKSIAIVVDATWAPSVILSSDFVEVNALVVLDEIIIAGTFGSGIYRSVDNGATWSAANSGLPNIFNARYVNSMTATGGAIFVGTNGAGIYRSLDNGVTWGEANSGLPAGSARFVVSMMATGGAIFAGTRGAGIYRSLDNGLTWGEANSGLPTGDAREVYSLATNGGAIFAGTTGAGIYRSLDNGASWGEANIGLPAGVARDVIALIASGGAIIAGTYGAGIYRSLDNGATWGEANTGLPAGSARNVYSLSAGGGAIFAGTNGAGIYRSLNNGATWVEANSGLPASSARSVRSLMVSVGAIFAGTRGAGIYRSVDNGATWGEANSGLPAGDSLRVLSLSVSGSVIIGGTGGAGIYRSSDNGTTWIAANSGLPNSPISRAVYSLTVSGGAIFAGTGTGIYRSLDNGATWNAASSGLPAGFPVYVLSLTASGGAIYAGVYGAGIYRSSDNGGTWSAINSGLPAGNARNVLSLTASGGAIFAGTNGAGIYRSLNNGATWVEANTGLPGGDGRVVRSLVAYGGTIFVGTGSFVDNINGVGIYRSVDNGATWNEANVGLPIGDARNVQSLTLSEGAIIAGTNGSGIYRSVDNGATWVEANSGLPGDARYVISLTASVATIIAGTDGAGIFTLTESAIVWESRNNGLSNTSISAAIVDGDALLVGTFGSGVYRTTDEGLKWTSANAGLPPYARVQALARTSSGTFAGLLGAGVYFSSDRGMSWSVRSNGLANLRVKALASDGAMLWAGTEGGIFRSTDQGINWTMTNTGLTDPRVLSLAVSSNGVYAGTANGLFRSNNGGNSWSAINNGLGNLYILSIGIAPDGNTLLAGTTNGLYRSTNGGANWTLVTNGISERVVPLTFAASGDKLLVGTFFGYYISTDNGSSWRPSNTGLFSLQVSALAVKGDRVFAGTRGAGVFTSRLE